MRVYIPPCYSLPGFLSASFLIWRLDRFLFCYPPARASWRQTDKRAEGFALRVLLPDDGGRQAADDHGGGTLCALARRQPPAGKTVAWRNIVTRLAATRDNKYSLHFHSLRTDNSLPLRKGANLT